MKAFFSKKLVCFCYHIFFLAALLTVAFLYSTSFFAKNIFSSYFFFCVVSLTFFLCNKIIRLNAVKKETKRFERSHDWVINMYLLMTLARATFVSRHFTKQFVRKWFPWLIPLLPSNKHIDQIFVGLKFILNLFIGNTLQQCPHFWDQMKSEKVYLYNKLGVDSSCFQWVNANLIKSCSERLQVKFYEH